MKFLQQLAFVVLISTIFIQTPGAKAEENASVLSSAIPFSTDYSYKNDPLLIDWTLHQEKPVETDTSELSTAYTEEEEAILAKRWYGKQVEKWKNLPKGKFIINASAYTAAADECGKNDGKTSSGLIVEAKRTLACPAEYPFGAKIKIAGVGVLRCEDRGGAIKGNHFDIYMETKKEALAFGRRNLEAEVVVD
ncbi:MAG: 3D domain-containing protein [Candidatus Moraniibacteriota bacterium]